MNRLKSSLTVIALAAITVITLSACASIIYLGIPYAHRGDNFDLKPGETKVFPYDVVRTGIYYVDAQLVVVPNEGLVAFIEPSFLPASQGTAKLTVTVPKDTKPGLYSLSVSARLNNGKYGHDGYSFLVVEDKSEQ